MDDADFKKKLNVEQYRVMREKDTERPFSGRYWDNEDHGLYSCVACGTPLFVSLSKFDAGLGWPTFHGPLRKANVVLGTAGPDGTNEVTCKKCGGHLGYLVPDEDDRKKPFYRINSAALSFRAMPEVDLPQPDDDADVESKKPQLEQWADKVGGLVSQLSPSALISSAVALVLGAVVAGASVSSLCKAPAPFTASTTATFETSVGTPVVTTPVAPVVTKPKKTVSPATSTAALASSSPNSPNASSTGANSAGTP